MSRPQNKFEPDPKPQNSPFGPQKSQKLKEHKKQMLFCYMRSPKKILNHNLKIKGFGG